MFVSIDLEMNQPSGKIIQIGAVFADLGTGVVWEKLSLVVSPGELLNPYITQLTGILQAQVDAAPPLQTQYEALVDRVHFHKPYRNPVVWGGGDSEELRVQLGTDKEKFVFGRRWIDVKTIYQTWRRSQSLPVHSGLAKSMIKCGLKFEGQKHQAADDALNTFRFYLFLLKKFRP
jgi:inhibitor of KinA sporulation pathway (predicted exonuclease)